MTADRDGETDRPDRHCRVLVRRSGEGTLIHPPGHAGVSALQRFGGGGEPDVVTVVLSRYSPGARAELSEVGETIYYVLGGELHLSIEHAEDYTLEQGDSVYMQSGTVRSIVNYGADEASILVVRDWSTTTPQAGR